MGTLGEVYTKYYDIVCRKHPDLRFLYFQWPIAKCLNDDLDRPLPKLIFFNNNSLLNAIKKGIMSNWAISQH